MASDFVKLMSEPESSNIFIELLIDIYLFVIARIFFVSSFYYHVR